MRVKHILLMTILISWTILISSCKLDLNTTKYPDYEHAKNGGVFDQGWIPSLVIYKSMTNIYQKTNSDLNTCIFSFKLPLSDLENLLTDIQLTGQSTPPTDINPPNWWTNKVEKLDHYTILDNNKGDTIWIAIDIKDNTVLGWRK